MPLPNCHAEEFDFSNVSLKELREVRATITEEMRMINRNSQTPAMKRRYEDLSLYSGFLYNSIQMKTFDEMNKTFDEMNKHYFEAKIPLKK